MAAGLNLDAWWDEPAYKTCNTFHLRGVFIFDKLKQHDPAKLHDVITDLYRDDPLDPQDIGKFEWQAILAYMGARVPLTGRVRVRGWSRRTPPNSPWA